MSSAARDEMTQWYMDRLEAAIGTSGNKLFFKACVDDPVDAGQRFEVGFCGWEAVDRAHSHTMTSHSHIAKETKGEAQPAQEQIHNSDNNSATSNTAIERKQGNRLPETLDAYGWVALSDKLKTERRRVLEDLDNVCRLTLWPYTRIFRPGGLDQ